MTDLERKLLYKLAEYDRKGKYEKEHVKLETKDKDAYYDLLDFLDNEKIKYDISFNDEKVYLTLPVADGLRSRYEPYADLVKTLDDQLSERGWKSFGFLRRK